MQFMGDYWLRHVRPDFTEDFAVSIDEGVVELVDSSIGVSTASFTDIGQERLRLPQRLKGCGLRQAVDRRHAQFLGGLTQSLPHLINHTDENNNVTAAGRMHVPSIVALLGATSFNKPLNAPWETLLSSNRDSTHLANGLDTAWTHLQTHFQSAATVDQLVDESSYLLNQEDKWAGFYPDGRHPKSVTNAVTVELERARSTALGRKVKEELPRNDFERWALEGWTKSSPIFLLSPIDEFGYMEDTEFTMSFTTYLGQECPVMKPLVGRFFGKKGQVLNKYGTNLASATLPGQGFRMTHRSLQSITMSLMRVAGIISQDEAVNFLSNKVGSPWIDRYIDHVAQSEVPSKAANAVVPDIHAFNYPTGRQRMNDSSACLTAEAIFEVKTMTACKSRYDHNNDNIRPVDRRANGVRVEYKGKFGKLDHRFAYDFIGPRDINGNFVGPFSLAQQRFFTKQIIPLVAGYFGDLGTDFEKTIRTVAWKASGTIDGLEISPLVNTDRKGGSFPIMLHQFRRAVSIASWRGNAQHKLARLHFVRATKEEAKAVHQANLRGNNWRADGQGPSSWYARHTADGYGAYQQFQNSYGFGMH